MSERTATSDTTVEEDGIRVEKTFADDEFPVPAVRYDLSSSREEAARVRIVDAIPETFPMDRVGFHPEYESDKWTAYKDHRVEFERVVDPGERVETIFGIRADDPDLDGFMATPTIEHVPVGEEIEDVLGTGGADAVREVLSGDRDTLPGMEEPAETREDESAGVGEEDATDPGDPTPVEANPSPRSTDGETTAAVTRRPDRDEIEDDAAENAAEVAESEDLESEVAESDTETYVDSDATVPRDGSVSAALAAEIRDGTVADDDLEVLRSELDLELPRSVDVRISRLQSSVADIEAYADALAEFIDDEGTAREVLDGLQARVDDVDADLSGIEDRLEAADQERSDLSDEFASLDESVTAVDDRVDTVEETVSSLESGVEGIEDDVTELDRTVDDISDDVQTLCECFDDVDAAVSRTDERVGDVEDRLDRFDTEFDDVWEDLAEVDERLTGVEDRLGSDVANVEAEIAAIHDQLEELEAFRKRLNEAFGP